MCSYCEVDVDDTRLGLFNLKPSLSFCDLAKLQRLSALVYSGKRQESFSSPKKKS